MFSLSVMTLFNIEGSTHDIRSTANGKIVHNLKIKGVKLLIPLCLHELFHKTRQYNPCKNQANVICLFFAVSSPL